jgi:hypothetical protein
MRTFVSVIFVSALLVLSGCSSNNDNAHTTATTIVPPPVRQQLRVSTRPATQLPAATAPVTPYEQDPHFNPKNPLLVFNLPNGKTFRQDEAVVIDFSVANAKLKGDGGEYRVRYIVDDEEMQWIDRWEDVVLSGWTPGKHTIRLELVGPDGWPVPDGVETREVTVIK